MSNMIKLDLHPSASQVSDLFLTDSNDHGCVVSLPNVGIHDDCVNRQSTINDRALFTAVKCASSDCKHN
jgi:hypothetical protein